MIIVLSMKNRKITENYFHVKKPNKKQILIFNTNFWHGYPNTNDWILADKNGILLNKKEILL